MARRKQGRRPNGEGTRTKRKDGRAERRLPPTIGLDGKMRRISVYGRTDEEAKAKYDELVRDLDNGIRQDALSITVGEHIDDWLASREGIRPSTMHAYEHALRYAAPLRQLKLRALTTARITKLSISLKRAGVSAAMRAKFLTCLSSAMRHAHRQGLISRNPVEDVDRPPVPVNRYPAWTERELLAFLDSIPPNHAAFGLVLVAAFTGLRRGELLGLRWQDFAEERDGSGTLHIVQAVVPRRGTGFDVSPPKTPKSVRDVTITPDVVNAIRCQEERVASLRASVGDAWHGSPAIFPSAVGTYLDPRNTSRLFSGLVERSGLPPIPLHGLRHTHASILIANGFDAGVVSQRLGHSSVAFTMERYRHLFDRQKRAAAFGPADLRMACNQLDATTEGQYRRSPN